MGPPRCSIPRQVPSTTSPMATIAAIQLTRVYIRHLRDPAGRPLAPLRSPCKRRPLAPAITRVRTASQLTLQVPPTALVTTPEPDLRRRWSIKDRLAAPQSPATRHSPQRTTIMVLFSAID